LPTELRDKDAIVKVNIK